MSTRTSIVVLNGPSSAGKTTLARAVRDRIGANGAAVSIDQFFQLMHPDAKNDWSMFCALTDALFATAATLANAGFEVVVDTVFERAECVRAAERALAGHAYHFVAVTCELSELERREVARGDRRVGQARDQHARVLQHATYSLTLDTSRLSVDECVTEVVQLFAASRNALATRR